MAEAVKNAPVYTKFWSFSIQQLELNHGIRQLHNSTIEIKYVSDHDHL